MDLTSGRSDDEDQPKKDGELFAVPESITTVGGYAWTLPFTTAGVERVFSVLKAMLDPCNHGLSAIKLNMRAMIRQGNAYK